MCEVFVIDLRGKGLLLRDVKQEKLFRILIIDKFYLFERNTGKISLMERNSIARGFFL